MTRARRLVSGLGTTRPLYMRSSTEFEKGVQPQRAARRAVHFTQSQNRPWIHPFSLGVHAVSFSSGCSLNTVEVGMHTCGLLKAGGQVHLWPTGCLAAKISMCLSDGTRRRSPCSSAFHCGPWINRSCYWPPSTTKYLACTHIWSPALRLNPREEFL